MAHNPRSNWTSGDIVKLIEEWENDDTGGPKA